MKSGTTPNMKCSWVNWFGLRMSMKNSKNVSCNSSPSYGAESGYEKNSNHTFNYYHHGIGVSQTARCDQPQRPGLIYDLLDFSRRLAGGRLRRCRNRPEGRHLSRLSLGFAQSAWIGVSALCLEGRSGCFCY